MARAVLGIIGGSGIYDLPGIEDVREQRVTTPWGEPSDVLRTGRVGGTSVVFLPRHGRGHRIPPSGINYRANIDALKQLGVTEDKIGVMAQAALDTSRGLLAKDPIHNNAESIAGLYRAAF